MHWHAQRYLQRHGFIVARGPALGDARRALARGRLDGGLSTAAGAGGNGCAPSIDAFLAALQVGESGRVIGVD